MSTKFIETDLPGVVIIEPARFGDSRGYFQELYHETRYGGWTGIEFKQDNLSFSTKGVLRGLHYQLENAQAKLVQAITGSVLDVAVDVRKGSPTFGKSVSVELTAESGRQLFIPPGFAHGFAVLSESAHFLYKCSELYAPGDEYGIRYDDPQLAIDWKVESPLVSEKDLVLPTLAEAPVAQLPQWNEAIPVVAAAN